MNITRTVIPPYNHLSCLHLAVGSMLLAEVFHRPLMTDKHNLPKKNTDRVNWDLLTCYLLCMKLLKFKEVDSIIHVLKQPGPTGLYVNDYQNVLCRICRSSDRTGDWGFVSVFFENDLLTVSPWCHGTVTCSFLGVCQKKRKKKKHPEWNIIQSVHWAPSSTLSWDQRESI